MYATVKRWAWVGLLLAGLMTGGCQTKFRSSGVMIESYPSTKITVNSKVFNRWFHIENSALAKGDNGLLKATITARNVKRECQVEYRFRWLDQDGVEFAPGTSSWIPASVAERETLLMTGIAPAKQASDFILDMRFPFKSKRW